MKKFVIFIALTISALGLLAQSGREKGYVFRPEVGIGAFGFGTYENICEINTFGKYSWNSSFSNNNVYLKNKGDSGLNYSLLANYGYQCNPFIYLGGGAGFYGNNGGVSEALYVNPRLYLGNRRFSFFFDLKGGYALNLFGTQADKDSYYIKKHVVDPTIYYYDETGFHETLEYDKFVTVKSGVYRVQGFFTSFAFGFEVNRSSYSFCLDLYNTNMKTTVENHYWEFSGDGYHSGNPTVYNTKTETYDDANKLGFTLAFRYGYSIF